MLEPLCGQHDNHHYNNIYAYAGQGLGVCSQLLGHEDYFYGNRVVLTGKKVGSFRCTSDATYGAVVVHDNAYYTADGNVSECNMDLPAWQAKGGDKGSSVAPYPKDEVVIQWAKEKLGF